METKQAWKELKKIIDEISKNLKSLGYSIGGGVSSTSIGAVQKEFRVQTKEIGFIIRIKAVKYESK